MTAIAQHRRDQLLQPPPNGSTHRPHPPMSAQELSFLIEHEIGVFLAAYSANDGNDYAAVLGALELARLDFTELIVKPYARGKRLTNGEHYPQTVIDRATRGGLHG